MRKITVHSDGFGGTGTVVLDDEGKIIEQVTGIDLHIEAQRVTEATVFMDMVQVNSEAHVTGMVFRCPLCGWQGAEHQCDSALGTQATQLQSQPISTIPGLIPSPIAPSPPSGMVMWNPTLPISICGAVNGPNTCRILSSVGTHDTHVDTITGAIWSVSFKSINPGTVYHV